MDIKKIKKAPYNPRLMDGDTRNALKSSMENFGDISGIVLNTKTGNILAGNHRWDSLVDKYGDNLVLSEISENIYSIDNKKKPTGFILRTVSWTLQKEKAANIAANSDLIMGEFTSDLQSILDELFESSNKIDIDLMSLRFDELSLDLEGIEKDLDLDEGDLRKRIQKDAESKNRALEDVESEDNGYGPSEVKTIIETIKVVVPSEIANDVRADLKKFVSKRVYAEDVKVL